jgi:hypothetical protein
MFNYPTCFEPITGSSSGMSQITITHTIVICEDEPVIGSQHVQL